jgi:hypothetical protein
MLQQFGGAAAGGKLVARQHHIKVLANPGSVRLRAHALFRIHFVVPIILG